MISFPTPTLSLSVMVETFLDRLAQYTFRSHLYSVSIIFSRVSNYLRGIFLLIWGILGDHIDIFGRLGGGGGDLHGVFFLGVESPYQLLFLALVDGDNLIMTSVSTQLCLISFSATPEEVSLEDLGSAVENSEF